MRLTIKVAHLVILSPSCGLSETASELVKELRELGVDSRRIDPTRDKADWDWAVKADIIVSHSGYDKTPVAKTDQPVVYVAHGRPFNSLSIQSEGGVPIYSYMYNKNNDDRIKVVVTFWPEHVDFHNVMFPDKPVECVQAPVDLKRWTDGPARYDFNGKGGEINVVLTDTWRQDGGPWLPLNAFALWARDNPGAKLHLYAAPKKLGGYVAILKTIKDDGNLGEVLGWVKKGLKEIYRSADLTLTGNEIDTRTVRESMACGCPVLKVRGPRCFLGLETDVAHALSQTRERTRALAESRFNPKVTAVQFKGILDNINGSSILR